MRLLFVHQNFPAQYKHLAPYFANNPANQVVAVGDQRIATHSKALADKIRLIGYREPAPASAAVHRYLSPVDVAVRRGEEVQKIAVELKREGFVPDIICAHPGWGEALFLKDAFPQTPILGFYEFYYSSNGADVGFDTEFPPVEDDACRVRIKNAIQLHSLAACDWGIVPTHWQLAQFPLRYHSSISVIFDGIDTNLIKPNPQIGLRLGDHQVTRADEVITFVNRTLEPYRGFHIFMRSLPRLLRERPKARVIIVGGDGASYGQLPRQGQSWRQVMLHEVGKELDLKRVHFVGRVPYPKFVALLQLSSVHVYLTYPFVLSWSMIEAMSAGCVVVGSATEPVQEVIGVNGLLVDFFSPDQIVDAVAKVLDHRTRMQSIRQAARRTVIDRYDLKRICPPKHVNLIKRLAAGCGDHNQISSQRCSPDEQRAS